MLSQYRTISSFPADAKTLEDAIVFIFNELKKRPPLAEQELKKLNSYIKETIDTARKLAPIQAQILPILQNFKDRTGTQIKSVPEITIDYLDKDGYTMLTWAARQDYGSTVALIIDDGEANLNFQVQGRTALGWAAFKGHVNIVKMLIQAKADTNIKDDSGNSAFMWAAAKGHQDILQLLAPQAKLELTNSKSYTALDEAIENKKLPAVRLLLDCKAAIRHPEKLLSFLESCDQREDDALAALKHLHHKLNTGVTGHYEEKKFSPTSSDLLTQVTKHLQILRELTATSLWTSTEHGIEQAIRNIVMQGKMGGTPLIWAAREGRQQLVEELITKSEVNLECENDRQYTALEEAIAHKKLPIVNLLLSHRAVIRHPDTLFNFLKDCYEHGLDTQTSFTYLRDALQTRLKKENTPKAKAHWSTLRDNTVVYIWAASQKPLANDPAITKTIMKYQKEYRITALMYAASEGHMDLVDALIEAKANVNNTDGYGHTALMFAAVTGHRAPAEALIQAGAKLEITSDNTESGNYTALYYAMESKEITTVSLLLDHKASIRHPKKLFNFLRDCDQKDPNVLSSFTHLLNELNRRLTQPNIDPELKTIRDLTITYIWAAQQPTYPSIIKIIRDAMNQADTFATALIRAVILGHHEAFMELVMKANASIDFPDKNGGTALIHATVLDSKEMVSILLQANADPNFYQEGSFYGFTALIAAASNGNQPIVDLLVKDPRTRVDIEAKNGGTALTKAALNGHTSIIRVLLETKKENVNRRLKTNGYTALMCAAMNGHEETAHILIEAKAELEVVNHDGETALDIAIKHKKLGMVVLLLGHNASIRNPEKLFDFLQSCAPKEPKMVLEILIYLDQQWSAHLITKNAELLHNLQCSLQLLRELNVTSLWTTSLYGTKAERMLRDALDQSQKGDTALIWATSIDDAKLVEELLQNSEAKPNVLGSDGHTPLTHAAKKGYLNIVKVFIKNKVDLDAKNDVGNTALIEAADQGHGEVVSELLEAKADPNILGQKETALTSAARSGDKKIVELLLAHCATPDMVNQLQNPPILCATMGGHEDIVRDLLEAKANPNLEGQNKHTALTYAASENYLKIVTLLIANNGNLNTQTVFGHTALMLAARDGYGKIAHNLLENKAELELLDTNGKTALDLAIENKKISTVALLLDHHASITNPTKLFDFLKSCDQRDPQVLASLRHLYNQWSTRLISPTEEKSASLHIPLLSKIKHHIQILEELAFTPLWVRFGDWYTDDKKNEKYNKESIEEALRYGARGHTALTWAVSAPLEHGWHGRYDPRKLIITALLEKAQVNPDTPGENGETALDIAIKKEKPYAVSLLLDHKASIQDPEKLFNFLKNSYENNKEVCASSFRHLCNALNTHLAAPNIPEEKSSLRKLRDITVIYIWHANHRHENIINLLNAIDADEKKHADTALMSAIRRGHDDIAIQLIEAKTALDSINNERELALEIAIKKNNFLIVSALLEQKSPIRDPQKLFDFLASCYQQKNIDLIKLKNAFTQLRNALNRTQLKTLKSLTVTHEWGGGEDDTQTIDRNDKRKLLYSRKPGDTALNRQTIITNLLHTRIYGDIILICAARSGCTALVHELLIANSTSINARGEGGYTALMRAARNGHADIVAQLIQAGAKLNLRNEKKQTAIEEAIENKQLSTMTVLLSTPGVIIPYGKTFNFLRNGDLHHKKEVARALALLRDRVATHIQKIQTEAKSSENYQRFLNKIENYLKTLNAPAVRRSSSRHHPLKCEPKPEPGSFSAVRENARPGGF